MYNESINTNNKIISTDLILNIFGRMNELIKSYTSKANKEEQTYNSLSFENQLNMKREFSNFISDFSFTVDFYDSTNITINNYESFMGIFNSRLHEIRSIISNFSISYFDVNNKSCSNSISLMIYENSFDIRVAIDTSNSEMSDLFNFIKSSKYKADKHSYINSSKVIIGKNIDNLVNRNKIKDLYYDKKKYIKFELIAIAVIALILLPIQVIR